MNEEIYNSPRQLHVIINLFDPCKASMSSFSSRACSCHRKSSLAIHSTWERIFILSARFLLILFGIISNLHNCYNTVVLRNTFRNLYIA